MFPTELPIFFFACATVAGWGYGGAELFKIKTFLPSLPSLCVAGIIDPQPLTQHLQRREGNDTDPAVAGVFHPDADADSTAAGLPGEAPTTAGSPSGDSTTSASPSGDPTTSASPSGDPTTSASPSEDPTAAGLPGEDPATSASPSEDLTTSASPNEDPTAAGLPGDDLTTSASPGPPPPAEFVGELRVTSLEWDEGLSDPESARRRELEERLEEQLRRLYPGADSVEVLGLSEGSVVVKYK